MTPLEEEIMGLRHGEEVSFRRDEDHRWILVTRARWMGESKMSTATVISDIQIRKFNGPEGMFATAARDLGRELDETPPVLPPRKNQKGS